MSAQEKLDFLLCLHASLEVDMTIDFELEKLEQYTGGIREMEKRVDSWNELGWGIFSYKQTETELKISGITQNVHRIAINRDIKAFFNWPKRKSSVTD